MYFGKTGARHRLQRGQGIYGKFRMRKVCEHKHWRRILFFKSKYYLIAIEKGLQIIAMMTLFLKYTLPPEPYMRHTYMYHSFELNSAQWSQAIHDDYQFMFSVLQTILKKKNKSPDWKLYNKSKLLFRNIFKTLISWWWWVGDGWVTLLMKK